jgi:hypothetical protein
MVLWIILAIVVIAAVANAFRVPLLAKLLGQPESRIRAQIERRKR